MLHAQRWVSIFYYLFFWDIGTNETDGGWGGRGFVMVLQIWSLNY